MSHRHVKLRSGHVLARQSTSLPQGASRHRQDVAVTLRPAINDHSLMAELRRLCAEWQQVARMSDHEIIDYLTHLVRTGQVHLVKQDVSPKATGGASGGAKDLRSAPSALFFSVTAKNLLKKIERLRLQPYDDQSGRDVTGWVKGATIGYGHLIGFGEWHTYQGGITKTEADTLFDKDSDPFTRLVRNAIKVKLTQNEFDALVILAYNIGPSPTEGFPGSSVVKLVNDPKAKTNYKSLESAWKAWNKSQGKMMAGLVNRRQCEWDIYSKNVYKGW